MTETPINISKISTIKNIYGLTPEDMEIVINSYKHPVVAEFWQKNIYEKGIIDYPEGVANWQITKSHEIRNLFNSNLKFEFNEDNVSITTNFTVNLPINWKKWEYIDWAMSFNDVWCSYLEMKMELVMEDKSHIYNDDSKKRIEAAFRSNKNSFIQNEKTTL